MPLTESVTFKTRLQIGNRVQVPKYVRWHYKLETTQSLEVSIKFHNNFHFAEIFLSRISKDGRIVIPKLTITLFKDGRIVIPKLTITLFKDGRSSLGNYIAEVTLKPL